MKIFDWATKVSKEDPMQQYDFKRFEEKCGDFYFIEARLKFSLLEQIKNKKIVYFDVEEPNRFMSPDPIFRREEYENYFYKIFNICPFTTEWLNNREKSDRRTTVYYPINEEKIPPVTQKKYDIIYIGNVNSKELEKNLKIISKYNYRFIARSHNVGISNIIRYKLGLKSKNDLITDREVDYATKMKILSETKIALVHGLLWCRGNLLRATWKTEGYVNNKAFSLLPKKTWYNYILSFIWSKEYIVPQFKTRFAEAAISRTLMLVRKDPFNVVERYYTPEKEFVYYEDGKLKEKIDEILQNWPKYQAIIDRAYERTIREYTTQAFFEKYLKNLK